ncbi:MFS transporter [Paenibacillus sp.]|uniref:MFS transporter n=1 Tax=Paenibacillus sp. TaxID=58172 RepID=UPI002810A51E|nr:MFS transporter [Paenibacillus sp.]
MNGSERPLQPGHLFVLLFVCIAAGYNQGALLPLLTVLLEREGVSAGMNGLNSTALYIGTFATMFFIRRPVARFGYRPVIAAGLILAGAASFAFPFWKTLAAWYALRLLVGIGDSALHFATQLWIVTTSPPERRGRYISLYGMCYGIGFSIGPLGMNALKLGETAPFALIAAFMALALALLYRLPGAKPFQEVGDKGGGGVRTVYRYAWFALIPAFLYGYMEASMNGNFPIYGLRVGFPEAQVSLLLLTIGLGSLALQLPLGALSDRIGRRPVLLACGLVGGLAFACVPLAGERVIAVAALFALAGGLVGSFFSLGLAYAADLLPKGRLPTANVVASIHFSVGSILGPYLGGLGIEHASRSSMFWLLGSFFLIYVIAGAAFAKPNNGKNLPTSG